MKNTPLLFILLLVAWCHVSRAQDSWTLEKCIGHASTNNLKIKQQATTTGSSAIALSRAKSEFLPTVSAYAEQNLNNSLDPLSVRKNYPSSDLGLSARWDLWKGHQVKYDIEKQEYINQASSLYLQATIQDVTLAVTDAFLGIVRETENVKNLEEQLLVTTKQADISKVRVEVGAIPKHELSRILMQQAQEKADLSESRNRLANATIKLAFLLNLGGDSLKNFTIAIPQVPNIDTTAIPDADTIYANAAKIYPSLLAQQLMVKSNESELNIARATGLPNVYLKASLGTRMSGIQYSNDKPGTTIPYATQLGDNTSSHIGIGISIPIFNKHYSKWQVAQSKITLATSQIELSQERDDLYVKSHYSWANARSAIEQFRAREQAAALAQEAFDAAQEKFNAGSLDGISFIIEKNNLAKAQSGFLLAKYQLLFILKQIDLLQGKPISL